jgi:membrane fusion protein (multidrug efflux system)
MKRYAIPSALLAGALTLLTGLAGCGGRGAQSSGSTDSTNVLLLGASDVAPVARAHLATGIAVSGTLAPAVDIRIGAPVADALEAVLVQEGQHVQKGEALARFRFTALAPAAVGAEAARKAAAADYERMQNLYREGAVSQRDVEVAEAQLRAAEAMHAFAQKRLDEATVRAPVAGVVSKRWVQAGDRPGDGDPLFQLVNTDELEFEATVASEFVAQLRIGAPVALTVSGFPAGGIRGHVARVNATADPATRQVKLYVRVPNPGHRLVGGLFASGRVLTGEARAVLAIPGNGVRHDSTGTFVWILDHDVVGRRAVVAGLRDEAQDLVEIRSGLRAGETAVVGPIEGLGTGQRARVGGREG